jgi:hypothetical protein
MAVSVDDLETLGLGRGEIRKIMKDAQLGKDEINSILNDIYIPFKPSREKLIDAQNKKGLYIPFGELNILRSMRRGDSLRKEEEQETDPVSNLFGITPNQTPTNLPNFGGAPTNVAEAEPQQSEPFFGNVQTASVQPSAGVRTTPSFLGSNPEEILKNLDIARRTG